MAGEKGRSRSATLPNKRQCMERTRVTTSHIATMDDGAQEYIPVTRIPYKRDLERALREFKRLEEINDHLHENECDVDEVLATGVNLRKWLRSSMATTNKCVRFHVIVESGVTAETITNKTTCDIMIVKVAGLPHQQAVGEIVFQLKDYGVNETNNVFDGYPGGTRIFTIDNVGNTSFREPDVFFSRRGPIVPPTVIIEFEDKHRSVNRLDLWCRGFFFTPGVRQVIGFKMYPPNINREVAALAIQYGLNNNGQVDIMDVVQRGVPLEIWNAIRFLPPPTQAQIGANINPWVVGDNAVLTLPRAECIFGAPVGAVVPAGNDRELDLFSILFEFLT